MDAKGEKENIDAPESYASAGKIERFEDLQAWKLAFEVARQVYAVTETFPASERFSLTAQLRRSAGSIPANIAEGFGRHAFKEYLRFLAFARGSIAETQSHLYLAQAAGFLSKDDFDKIYQISVDARKTLQGLVRHLRNVMDAHKISEPTPEYFDPRADGIDDRS